MTRISDQTPPGPDPQPTPRRVLILGGTTEAGALARALALRTDIAATLSLAGRTRAPRPEPIPTRVGGFGGADGLADWIAAAAIGAVIDATHPFAARISGNAAEACARTGVPLLAVRRPEWTCRPGDLWHEVGSVAECADALGTAPRRVFLTVGRQEVAAFARAPQHRYLVRSIEPLGAVAPPQIAWIGARGPFSRADETALMRDHRIEVLVTKNSGGAATYAKIEAARDLRIPVIVARRPPMPEVPAVADARAALLWLDGLPAWAGDG